MRRNKTPIKLFIIAFAALTVLTLYQNFNKSQMTSLRVKDNKGTSFLETAGDSLVCIFQDGRVCVWDWAVPPARQGDFQAASPHAVVVDPKRMAVVSALGRKVLTVHALPDGRKLKEFAVGFDDQDVWPRVSFDKSVTALIRRSPEGSNRLLYEFMAVDIENELTGLPASLTIDTKGESLIDYAVDAARIVYAGGSRDESGRIAAVNLETGGIKWDRTFEGTREFCSIVVSPDGQYLLAGNRDGVLYKINTANGGIEKQIALLEPGETRPITNDYSVLNLAFSPDGACYAATINPPAYVLDARSDTVVHTVSPADKLVSKIAFSPRNEFLATSDIRAGYPIKILPMPEDK